MSLTLHLAEYVRACFTGLWIESHEQRRGLQSLLDRVLDREFVDANSFPDNSPACRSTARDDDRLRRERASAQRR